MTATLRRSGVFAIDGSHRSLRLRYVVSTQERDGFERRALDLIERTSSNIEVLRGRPRPMGSNLMSGAE